MRDLSKTRKKVSCSLVPRFLDLLSTHAREKMWKSRVWRRTWNRGRTVIMERGRAKCHSLTTPTHRLHSTCLRLLFVSYTSFAEPVPWSSLIFSFCHLWKPAVYVFTCTCQTVTLRVSQAEYRTERLVSSVICDTYTRFVQSWLHLEYEQLLYIWTYKYVYRLGTNCTESLLKKSTSSYRDHALGWMCTYKVTCW